MLYVQFDAVGNPAVIYDTPRDGADPVDGMSWAFLASHRRVNGEWGAREPLAHVPPSPEELADLAAAQLATEREAMVCSPSQMRIALHRLGLLTTVQAIADSDPEASIVWEYATQIVRGSPFISAIGSVQFTEDEIDDLFRAAMTVSI